MREARYRDDERQERAYLEAWVCREFHVLPTESRFQRMEPEQMLALFGLCNRMVGSDIMRQAFFEEEQAIQKKEREEERKKQISVAPLLVKRMKQRLIAGGMDPEEADEVVAKRLDQFLRIASEDRESTPKQSPEQQQAAAIEAAKAAARAKARAAQRRG